MTVHAPKLLTPEEFASLIEVAVTAPNPKIPATHLTKLVTLGYVTVTAKGPIDALGITIDASAPAVSGSPAKLTTAATLGSGKTLRQRPAQVQYRPSARFACFAQHGRA